MTYKVYVETSFEMSDGRTFKCEYTYIAYPGTYFEPPECDVGEPQYSIDGEEIDENKLPKGLEVIAEKLYNASIGEFNYKQCIDCADPEDWH